MPTNFSTLEKLALDTNVENAVTDALDIRGGYNLGFQVLDNSGTHATHIITLQVSADGTNWQNTAHTLTGLGVKDNVGTSLCWARLKVTKAEGAASTCDVYLQSK